MSHAECLWFALHHRQIIHVLCNDDHLLTDRTSCTVRNSNSQDQFRLLLMIQTCFRFQADQIALYQEPVITQRRCQYIVGIRVGE